MPALRPTERTLGSEGVEHGLHKEASPYHVDLLAGAGPWVTDQAKQTDISTATAPAVARKTILAPIEAPP